MLIRIVATNFKSYKDETEFNMLPSSSVRRKDWCGVPPQVRREYWRDL